jgi:hypothetical protein
MTEVKVPARHARVDAWVISRDTDAEVRFLASAFEAAETPGSGRRLICNAPLHEELQQ